MLHTLQKLLLLQELHLLVLLRESAREDGLGVEGDLGLEPGQGGEQYSTVQYSTVQYSTVQYSTWRGWRTPR